jgi:hypothetical protein
MNARLVVRRRSKVPVLHTAGYPENAIIYHGWLAFTTADSIRGASLRKPYPKPDLVLTVRRGLAA